MISSAKLSYLRITSRKVRLVADLIRGETVERAQTILNFTRRKAAQPILKLLNQALANALNENPKLNQENLFISEIFVNEGPAYKRTFPRSRGRADIKKKKTSHITITLDFLEGKGKRKKASLKKKTVKETKIRTDKGETKETEKVQETKKAKERMKKRMMADRIRPKREGGIRKFFRRKAI